jgi:hypothetical protein
MACFHHFAFEYRLGEGAREGKERKISRTSYDNLR